MQLDGGTPSVSSESALTTLSIGIAVREGDRAMTTSFRNGDKEIGAAMAVTGVGAVEQKVTSCTDTACRTFDASRDKPQYLVRGDRSGRPSRRGHSTESRPEGQLTWS